MTTGHSMDRTFLNKLLAILEINIENEDFGVLELASEIGLSRSQLHRKLKRINGKSTTQFIREYRLEKAMEMLKQDVATASEIAYRVGFASPTYFNTCFHNFYGYPPGEVKFIKSVEPPKKSFKKVMMNIAPVAILIGLLVYNINLNEAEIDTAKLEKTVAVLPFVNDSPKDENIYFCNGIMAGIRGHLAQIPEFTVVSLYAVEQYRGQASATKKIAKELDVNFLVEGRVQRIGDRAIILAELIRAGDNKVLWSERYDKDVSEIFEVQFEVVQSLANRLETILSSDIKNQLNTSPTSDKLAIDHQLKGDEYRKKSRNHPIKSQIWLDLLSKSSLSHELAIERDSLYADAYLGLAYTIIEKSRPFDQFQMLERSDLDEALALINKAIQIDSTLSYAYSNRALYYDITDQTDKAIKNAKKALDLNPNNGHAASILLSIYTNDRNYKEGVILLKKTEKIAESKRDLYTVYDYYTWYYAQLEQPNMVDYYFNKASKIDATYKRQRIWYLYHTGQFDKALDYVKKKYRVNDQEQYALFAITYHLMGDYTKAGEYYEKWYQQVKENGTYSFYSKFGYGAYGSYLIREGQIEKGKVLVQQQLNNFDKLLNDERRINPHVYYESVALYYLLGDYDKACENMEKLRFGGSGMLAYAKLDDRFDDFKNDPHYIEWIKKGEEQQAQLQKEIWAYLPSTPPN